MLSYFFLFRACSAVLWRATFSAMKSKTSCGKISLALPHELLSRLDETARREGRSRSAQVRYTLNKALVSHRVHDEKS